MFFFSEQKQITSALLLIFYSRENFFFFGEIFNLSLLIVQEENYGAETSNTSVRHFTVYLLTFSHSPKRNRDLFYLFNLHLQLINSLSEQEVIFFITLQISLVYSGRLSNVSILSAPSILFVNLNYNLSFSYVKLFRTYTELKNPQKT